MALSQSALLDLLSALDAADGVERVRLSMQRMNEELIEAEASSAPRAAAPVPPHWGARSS